MCKGTSFSNLINFIQPTEMKHFLHLVIAMTWKTLQYVHLYDIHYLNKNETIRETNESPKGFKTTFACNNTSKIGRIGIKREALDRT